MTDLKTVASNGDLTALSAPPTDGDASDNWQDFAHVSQAWDASLGTSHPTPNSGNIDGNRPFKQNGQSDASTIETKRIRDVLADAQDVLQTNYRLVSESTDDFVHNNPWQAIGVAVLSGLAIGMLARR